MIPRSVRFQPPFCWMTPVTTTYHDNLDACLEDGVEAILCLTGARAMVGPAKCVLGADKAEHMGE